MAPLQEGVNPTLLPEGDTDITAVQKAVGNDKGIGRRLAAACMPTQSGQLECLSLISA